MPLTRMLTALRHRGPDTEGVYVQDWAGIAFGMRRLAIMDPEHGHQPIFGDRDDVALVLNGEIYNAPELARGLRARGHRFASGSDAEVVVHLYEERGLDAFRSLSGMYAAALWDGARRTLVLVRDPTGQKPLLVRETPHGLRFASDLRALLAADPELPFPSLQPVALEEYLTYRACVGRESVLEGIARLFPGEAWLVQDGTVVARCTVHTPSLPSHLPIPGSGAHGEEGAGGDPARAVRTTERLLEEAVARTAQTDTPLGMLLSGGIDSGLVLALLAKGGRAADVPAFVADWVDIPGLPSEWPHARMLAERLGARPERVPIRAATLADVDALSPIVRALDEPIGDPTAIPLWFTARAAASEVRVVLTGEGADEVFAGYPGYLEPLHAMRLARVARHPAGQFARRALRRLGLPGGGLLERAGAPPHSRYLGPGATFDRAARAALFPARPSGAADAAPEALARSVTAAYPPERWLEAMLAVDRTLWLPWEALMKLDRMTMAHALEARAPYLDDALLAYVDARTPAERTGPGRPATKWLLRQVALRHLPDAAARRPKRGFPVPVSHLVANVWRADLRDLLSDPRGLVGSLSAPGAAARLVDGVPSGRPSALARQAYALLVLELWYREVRAMVTGVPGETACEAPRSMRTSARLGMPLRS